MSFDASNDESRLSRIETLWSVVKQAHDSPTDQARAAQQALLEKYGLAVHRYLHGTLRDPHLADDLFQDFALKFVNGDLRNADPSKGRFRGYVKTVLYRMIADAYRRDQRRGEQELQEQHEPTVDSSTSQFSEEAFLLSWRQALLDRTWQALAEHESRTGTCYYSVLQLRVSQPTLSGQALAESLSNLLGKTTQPGSARVLIHRARDKFAHLLIETVRDSLSDPSDAAVQEELSELRLMSFCRGFFDPSHEEKK